MAVITRWSYKQGGRKAGFHCIRNAGTYMYYTIVHGTTHAKSTETSQCYLSNKMIKIIRKPDNYMYK